MLINSVAPYYIALNEKSLNLEILGTGLDETSQILLNNDINLSFLVKNSDLLSISQEIPAGAIHPGKNFIKVIFNSGSVIEKFITAVPRPEVSFLKKFSKAESNLFLLDKPNFEIFNDESAEIEIQGKNLSYVDRIYIGNQEIVNFSIISDNIIKITAPAYLSLGNHIVSAGSLGVYSKNNATLTVNIKKPNISILSPSKIHSGTTKNISIIGNGLSDPSLILSINGVTVEYDKIDLETITFPFYQEETGFVKILLSNSAGSFAYDNLLEVIKTPSFVSISPSRISGNGQVQVEVTGDNLDLIGSVTSDLTNSINIISKSKTNLVLDLNLDDDNIPGLYNLVFYTIYDDFVFTECLEFIGPLVIDSIFPQSAAFNEEATVLIQGQNLVLGDTKVFINNKEALDVKVETNGEKAIAILPSGIPTGTYNVVVQSSFGSETLENTFTYTTQNQVGTNAAGLPNPSLPSSSIYPTSIDSNQDNIPDSWDRIYFPNQVGQIDHRATDSNGNNINNYREYIFGTNPVKGSNPYLPTLTYLPPSGPFLTGAVYFQTYLNRRYSVITGNFARPYFQVGPTITGDGTFKTVNVNISGFPSVFFRINVEKYEPIPFINRTSPAEISITGGKLFISGDYFSSTSGISLNGSGIDMNSQRIYVASDNSIELNVPPSTFIGPVNVEVRTHGGNSILNNAFSYVPESPIFNGITPNIVPISASNITATISGSNLDTITSVKFGNVTTSLISNKNRTSLNVTIPSQSVAGIVPITLINNRNEQVVANNAFTYAGNPSITGISPTVGQQLTQQNITLHGTNLSNVSSVQLTNPNYSPLNLSFGIQNSTTITGRVPNTVPGGDHVITATSTIAGISRSSSIGFPIPETLAISGLNPLLHPSGINSELQIIGSGFTVPNNLNLRPTVRINNQNCELVSFTKNSILVKTPQLAINTYPVTVIVGTNQVQSSQQLNVINFYPTYTMPTLVDETLSTSSTINTIYTTHQ